ncbi:MAG: hypothetical protein Q4F23_02165, partial [Coriobacteriia bacterium]|nr:hypothetical protein [Coriobacteriia bacterium]
MGGTTKRFLTFMGPIWMGCEICLTLIAVLPCRTGSKVVSVHLSLAMVVELRMPGFLSYSNVFGLFERRSCGILL